MLPTANLARLLAMLPATAAMLAQTAPQPASVSGTVSNSLTGEPILRAHVTFYCTPEDRREDPQKHGVYGALSDDKGRFFHHGIAAGLKLTLTPDGVITGRALDSAGEPVEGVAEPARAPAKAPYPHTVVRLAPAERSDVQPDQMCCLTLTVHSSFGPQSTFSALGVQA